MDPKDERITDAMLAIFGGLVGGADDDELVREFVDVDPDSEVQMLPRLPAYLVAALVRVGPAALEDAQRHLEHILSTYDAAGLERAFDFFLFPFNTPQDPRQFFGWVLAIISE